MRLVSSLLLAVCLTASAAAQLPSANIIFVPSDGDANDNGAALLDAVAHISGDSANQPMMIQLDAGTYAVRKSVVLLPWVSIRGAGINSTILSAGTAQVVTTLFFEDQLISPYAQLPSNESVSQLTIIGNQALSATINGFLAVDQVHLISSGHSIFDLISPGSHFAVANSLLGSITITNYTPGYTSALPILSTFSATEADFSLALAPPFAVACFGTYNALGRILSQSCQ